MSVLIEIRRFYFPNINKKDEFGYEKPLAYQGYRHIALDFLVVMYQMPDDTNISKCKEKIEYMERNFTSIVFEVVSPNKRIKSMKQYAKITMAREMSIEDFIDSKCDETSIDTIFEYYK